MNTIRLAFLLSIGSCVLGCGGSSQSREDIRKTAQESFNAAETSFEGKDYTAAEKEYTVALGGGLNIDYLDKAAVKRAICRAEMGDIDQATADLNEWEQKALQLDLVYAAQSYVFEKQGKSKEAREAWNKAKRINKNVQKLGD